MPVTVSHANRIIRLAAVSLKYQPLQEKEIGLLGTVSARQDLIERVRIMNAHFADNRAPFDKLAARGQYQSYLLYSEPVVFRTRLPAVMDDGDSRGGQGHPLL